MTRLPGDTPEDDSLLRLIGYLRTSTDDKQSPKESRRWQQRLARNTANGRAVIVGWVQDVDVSRSIPWSRRPEASLLIQEMGNPNRGWDGIIVGEAPRAFGDGSQVQTVMRQVNHFGVQLWVPEFGGPVDPKSDTHDLMMMVAGSLSRAGRNRLRVRVQESMMAMAPEGRFLGGRPPYGYRIVRTGVPHPNPEKARQGIQLTGLEKNPETAPFVKQIFAWRAEGLGYRAIASRLTADGVACPSAADRERNPHRLGRAWSMSATRAIVENPSYMGTRAYGRYRKTDRLVSFNDPAAGYKTIQVPAPSEDVMLLPGLVEAIVTPDEWQAAQTEKSPTRPGSRPDTPTGSSSSYSLLGLLTCGSCGRKMQGNAIRRKKAERRVGYRCRYRTDYPGDVGHAETVFIAESRILPVIDDWLMAVSAANLEETVQAMLEHASEVIGEPPEVRHARQVVQEARMKLDRYIAAIEAGMDPTLLAEKSKAAQSEMVAARAVLDRAAMTMAAPLTEEEIRDVMTRLGSIFPLLDHATPDERRQAYQELGLRVAYHRVGGREKLVAGLGVDFLRVGGGT